MSISSWQKDIHRVIARRNYKEIHEILLRYSNWVDRYSSMDMIKLLMSEISRRDDEEIIEVFDHFQRFFNFESIDLDFFDISNLKMYLVNAVNNGKVLFAEFLLKNDVRLESSNWMDYRIFDRKNIDSRKEMLLLLLEYKELDTEYRNENGENILHKFIRFHVLNHDKDAVEISEILINAGVNVNELNNDGFSPFFDAVWKQNIPLILFLINKGADVNQSKPFQRFPLMTAYSNNNQNIVNLLLSNGADTNAQDLSGSTVLHKACFYHHEEKIILFISEGADVRVEDNHHNTPFSQLKSTKSNYNKCCCIMIKEFSKLIFENSSVSENDMYSIFENPMLREYFEKCMAEVEHMDSIKFYPPYSYYCILKMSKNIKKLAKLTKNEEFVKKFVTHLHKFLCYENDLRKILKKAMQVRDEVENVYLILNSIFSDFLPSIVIRKLSDNLKLKDLPLE